MHAMFDVGLGGKNHNGNESDPWSGLKGAWGGRATPIDEFEILCDEKKATKLMRLAEVSTSGLDSLEHCVEAAKPRKKGEASALALSLVNVLPPGPLGCVVGNVAESVVTLSIAGWDSGSANMSVASGKGEGVRDERAEAKGGAGVGVGVANSGSTAAAGGAATRTTTTTKSRTTHSKKEKSKKPTVTTTKAMTAITKKKGATILMTEATKKKMNTKKTMKKKKKKKEKKAVVHKLPLDFTPLKNLRSISLVACNIGSCSIFAVITRACRKLLRLDLSYNNLSADWDEEEDGPLLASLLSVTGTLKDLSLEACSIPSFGRQLGITLGTGLLRTYCIGLIGLGCKACGH